MKDKKLIEKQRIINRTVLNYMQRAVRIHNKIFTENYRGSGKNIVRIAKMIRLEEYIYE